MRRETIFGDKESGKKVASDLKKSDRLRILELEANIAKYKTFELAGESSDNLMTRFLLHFLFVEHNNT